jgi:phosphoadenosine phosphosulfate reductase
LSHNALNIVATGRLARLEAKAIAFIRAWADPADPPQVFFSGGKDSVVLEYLVRASGVPHRTFFNDSAIECPESKKMIREHYPHITWLRRPYNYWQLLVKYGYPSRGRQWCCYFIKEKPHPLAMGRYKFVGVRAAESARRAKKTQISLGGQHKRRREYFMKPIFGWEEEDVWECIEKHDLPVNPIYTELGWGRVGCIICPWICNKNRFKVDAHKARWPGLFFLFEKKMRQVYEVHKKKWQRWNPGRELVGPETFIDNWYRGSQVPYLKLEE